MRLKYLPLLSVLCGLAPIAAADANACAQVSSSAMAALATAPSDVPTVSGQLAYDCLVSAPLGQPQAVALLESILAYVPWQSDISHLKNPPSSYLEPAVDIMAELNTVYEKVNSSTYTSEYEFQADLFRVFNLAHDGHFRFFPDLLTEAITFSRGVSLVSASLNGRDLPRIYVHSDIQSQVGSDRFNVSAVKSINGQDVVSYMNNWAQLGALNDPDALYNSMFFSKAFAASSPGWNGYFDGSARFGYIWPGAETELVFQNGTKRTYPTIARVIGNFSGVTDGQSLYQKFCLPKAPKEDEPIATRPGHNTPPPGYPVAEVVSSDYTISGYFLNSTGNSDVAVLSMLSFEPNKPSEFQAVLQSFLEDAMASGKKKLVVDVSANSGGYVLQGYDTFRQLFPEIVQDGFSRFRYTETLALLAQQFSGAIPDNFDPNTASSELINMYEAVPNYRYDLNSRNEPFKSVEDKFGPHIFNGDNFTSLLRWNLDDPLTTINNSYGMGIEITGYGTRTNFTQPFSAEDIVLVYDGYCGSTCTLFSEFMRVQAGVKSIAFGGRPSLGPIQGVGGTKGANNYDFSYITYLASLAINTSAPEQRQWSNWTSLASLNTLAANRSSDNSLNVRDDILPSNIGDGLPAQFVYEPADCRLFYEPAMLVDVAALWEAAADAAWGTKSCVNGHLSLKKRTITEKPRPHPRSLKRAIVDANDFEMISKDTFWRFRHGTAVPL